MVDGLSAYARHRGCRLSAVQKAIKTKRLRESIVLVGGKQRIDFERADQEWAANTNAVKASAKLTTAVVVPSAARARGTPPAARPPEDHQPDGRQSASLRDTAPGTLSLPDALAFEKDMKARLAELEFMQLSGELVRAKDVEARIVDEYSRCRTKLLGLPRKAKALIPHLTHADVVTLDNVVREALEDLAATPVAVEQAS